MELSSPRNNRATEFHPFSTSPPHMLAFHVAWLSLFSCFFSTFSIPPLIPIIRQNLNLLAVDVGAAGKATFVSSIFFLLAMGPVCDLVAIGPRIASATLSILIAPIVLATAFISSPSSFILVRFLVGFNFVANQFWISSIFPTSLVGVANGFSVGWASMGAGIAQLIMPLLFSLVKSFNVPENTAWRVVFVFPATFQAITAVLVLVYSQELPRENHENLKKVSNKPNESFLEVIFNGLMNHRRWILGLIYAFTFGVEMTMDNIIAQYFYYIFGIVPFVSKRYDQR
ncbi:high affinity nitrate transporter 2.7-like [Hibiscus syriacus]|uniref:high affinity nitrate transporter 2.7-like n=1 Tax=Hibiscus syriacus TaxID=106335 RepID=UPI001924980A|nr:high affinity nitrate transporter 2.7-like [Hibiscus syriacus]